MQLELGCGEKPTPGYLHQDTFHFNGLDFCCNPWEINLPAQSLSRVIALGVVEHLRFKEVSMTLSHMHFLLKEGGEFLFDVPDMTVWSEYLYNMLHGKSHENPFNDEHVWNTIYGWQRWIGDEHKSGWSRDSLMAECKKAGFKGFEEGVHFFTNLSIQRGRFYRSGDAHIYARLTK